jgi:hypothetical protein
MKNITKLAIVLLSSSLISFGAVAGELAVSGSAKASYVINGGDQNNSNKGLGVSNELMFKASGELDNGYTWAYHTELDMADGGAASNDDTALVLTLGDMGAFGIYDAEGGLSTELGYGIGALGVGQDYANVMTKIGGFGYDVSADPHVEYHMPADLLPAGIKLSAGYAPNVADGQGNSFKNSGAVQTKGTGSGGAAEQLRLSATPVDGLTVGADYYRAKNTTTISDKKNGGNMYAKYAFGNFKVGAMKGYGEPGQVAKKGTAAADTATAENGDKYENSAMGVEFAINDNLSVSYQVEQNERFDKTLAANGGTTYVETSVESESDTIQVAYNVGGATVGVFVIDTDNADYTVGKEETKSVISLAMAF